jgi:hypothetical protein
MDKADIKKLKESGVFGPLTFWVTEIKNLEEAGNPNAAVRGRLRLVYKIVLGVLLVRSTTYSTSALCGL